MPILRNGVQIGVLILGIDISTEDYIDNIKNITGLECTLFKGDERLMTTIVDETGNRAIGTRLEDAEIVNNVLNENEIVLKRLDLFGVPFHNVYWPIEDFAGNTVGMWSIGMPLTQQIADERWYVSIVIICAIIIAVVFSVLAATLGHRITRPIRDVTDYAIQVADGKLDARISAKSNDEVGALATALETMVVTLKDRIRREERDLTKMKIMVGATKIGLWEMEIEQGKAVDINNKIIWSAEFRELLGFSGEDDFPNNISSFRDCLSTEDYEKVRATVASHVEDRTGKTPLDIEFKAAKKNGEVGYYHATGETIRDEGGTAVQFVGSMTDLSEMKSLINEAETQRENAEAANQAKSDFLSVMSHEMRTPLNAIIGLSGLTLEGDEIRGEATANLEKIYSSGEMLLSIVNDMLDLSKIEAGRMALQEIEYDVPSLINDTVTQNVLRIEEKPIEIDLDIDETVFSRLYGDELRVKQIINNLLSNAIKYTEKGTVGLKVHCDRDDDLVWVTIIISDTGIGIRPEDIKELFKEYSQLDMSINRNTEGTGLGLPITKKLVQMMDGTIDVVSEYGKGSVFKVKIAQKYVNDVHIGQDVVNNLKYFNYANEKRDRNKRLKRISLPDAHVLVVDDNMTNLDVAKGLLKPYGMQIDTATGGQEAVDLIRNEQVFYNAIFMDHMMPGIDGIEATRIIREEIGTEYAETVPIIALTANAIAGNDVMFMKNGFQAFVSKPIDIARLDEVIKVWIRDKGKLSWETDHAGGNDRLELSGITGLNSVKGIENLGGDEEIYLEILKSFAVNTAPLLESIGDVIDEKPDEYAIIVHGIKSSGRSIGADAVADAAEKLEMAAKAGDREFVSASNPTFIEAAWRLIKEINSYLG